jgi:hypothetical protein
MRGLSQPRRRSRNRVGMAQRRASSTFNVAASPRSRGAAWALKDVVLLALANLFRSAAVVGRARGDVCSVGYTPAGRVGVMLCA